MRPTQLGILFSLLLLTPTALKAQSEEDWAALTDYLNRALSAYNGSSGSLRYPNKVRTAWENHWRTAPLDW